MTGTGTGLDVGVPPAARRPAPIRRGIGAEHPHDSPEALAPLATDTEDAP